ncbi:hypothetical protein ACQY0O_006573 [Thecaphora frezii]
MRVAHLVWTAALLWTLLATLVGAVGPGWLDRLLDSKGMKDDHKPVRRRVALVFTDAKLDDQLAFHGMARSGLYEKIIVALSGITDTQEGSRVLETFFESMGTKTTGVLFAYIHVGNPFQRPLPHEETFKTVESDIKPTLWEYNRNSLRLLLGEKVVDVYQIAPVSPLAMQILLDESHSFKIHMLVILHGYNTRFASPLPEGYLPQEQTKYVQNVQRRLRKHHPKAFVVFTDSSQNTFPGGDGGSLLEKRLVQLGVPEKHIDMSKRDRFTERQYENAAQLLNEDKKLTKQRLVPKYWMDADMDWNDILFPRETPMAPIFYARKHEDGLASALRGHYIHLAKSYMVDLNPLYARITDDKKKAKIDQVRKRFIAVVALFENSLVEAYDALHTYCVIAVTSKAVDEIGLRPVQLHPQTPESQAIFHPCDEDDAHGYALTPVPEGWVTRDLESWLGSLRRP